MTSKFVPSSDSPLRIGTRQSPLAMAQASMAAAALASAHGLAENAVQVKPMLSGGDKVQDRPLAEIGGKALWTKELEHALLADEIDIAVHSMKDVETVRPDNFRIAAMLPRADVRDCLIGADSLSALKQGARIGTSSPRRTAQLLNIRPDLHIVPLRGNVATRLQKISDGEADATLLAKAGLDRLDMHDVGHPLATEELLPAASQGAVGIDCRSDRADITAFLASVDHGPTHKAVAAERGFLGALGGDCQSPVSAYARREGGVLRLTGQIFTADGGEQQSGSVVISGGDKDAAAKLARQLLDAASPALQALFSPSALFP